MLVSNEINGIILNDRNPLNLSTAIIDLIENPTKRESMGLNGINSAQAYDKKVIINKWIKLFHSLLKNDHKTL